MWKSDRGAHFVAILRDVTERQRIQEELRRHRENLEQIVAERTADLKKINEKLQQEITANRRLVSIVEQSDDAIIGMTLDGIIVSWNRGAGKISRYDQEEAVGRSVSFLIAEDRMAELPEILELLRKGDRLEHFESVWKRKDGSLIDVSLTVSPVRDEEGNIMGASAIARDITKAKTAERDLKERDRELFTLLGDLPGMVYRCINDSGWTMKFVSNGCLQLTGYDPSEYVNVNKRSYNELIHPDDRVTVLQSIKKALDRKESYRISYRIRTASQEEKWVREQGSGAYGQDGKLLWWQGYVADITDLKRAEEELEKRVRIRTSELRQANQSLENALSTLKHAQDHLVQSQKMAALGEIVAGVAHEINTPVGVAVTASSYLEMKTKEIERLISTDVLRKPDLAKYVKRVLEISDTLLTNLSRASDLVKSFKQVAVDQAQEERRKFSLSDYIHKVLLSLRPRYKRTQHVITVNCPEDLEIYSFPGAFYQIISNLVMNSLIHGFIGIDAGAIIFDIRADGDNLIFKYSDDGKGIAQENLEKIFNPFFTTRRARGSTGLGLHLVYNLVTQTLKGQITCRSSPGMGAEFEIVMPLQR